jgi:hypothetical protein
VDSLIGRSKKRPTLRPTTRSVPAGEAIERKSRVNLIALTKTPSFFKQSRRIAWSVLALHPAPICRFRCLLWQVSHPPRAAGRDARKLINEACRKEVWQKEKAKGKKG